MKLLSLCTILFLKALLMVWLVTSGTIGLGPDEAQYWTWSQSLDWGYYSKPPGIAWLIYFGTQIFGNSELGVRFGSILVGSLIPLAVYALARACRLQKETAFWAGLILAFSPLGILSSLFAITDVGMVFFWTLSCIVIASALAKGITPNYYLFGFLICVGAFFKWPIYLLWIFPFLLMPVYSNLRSFHFIGGLFVSLFGLLPSVIWNSQHDWATFQHVFTTMQGGHAREAGATPLIQGNLFDFLGAQAGLLSPILFVLLIMAFVVMIRNIREMWPSVLFCGITSLVLLGVYSGVAIFQKMQGNWVDFAYPTAIVLLAWYACERVSWGKRWIKIGLAFSVVMVTFVLSVPYLQLNSVVKIPYKLNPFRHNVGWNELADALKDVGYDPEENFLFGDKYQMSSELSFYGPGQKRAYFLNLHGARKNQFSYWPSMSEEQVGKTGYFVLAENAPYLEKDYEKRLEDYQNALQEYFSEVEFLGVKPLFSSYDQLLKGALIYKCVGYNGREPEESFLF